MIIGAQTLLQPRRPAPRWLWSTSYTGYAIAGKSHEKAAESMQQNPCIDLAAVLVRLNQGNEVEYLWSMKLSRSGTHLRRTGLD